MTIMLAIIGTLRPGKDHGSLGTWDYGAKACGFVGPLREWWTKEEGYLKHLEAPRAALGN